MLRWYQEICLSRRMKMILTLKEEANHQRQRRFVFYSLLLRMGGNEKENIGDMFHPSA